MAEIPSILNQGYGYGIVLGLGMGFGFMMYGEAFLEKRYLHTNLENSESYMTGDRSVKTGMVAAAVFSSWTWAATLLQSSAVAYLYGVSGPFWYAAGATVQVLLFATLAIELKRVAPNAHTFLEIVRLRYGKAAHILYICFSLATNMIVTSMLLLGGSATISYLTSMDVNAACMLFPVGVIMYTSVGGIKATFLMDYTHTIILYIIIVVFAMNVYGVNPLIGSIDKMYELLQTASVLQPVPLNAGGSYLTMASVDGILFGVINIVGNFGTVFVDNAYWQRAIAAHPKYCVNAYLLGGLSWFAVPFALATTLGLAGRALLLNTTPADVSAGLVLPQAASALLGRGGAIMALLIVFFAVTSSLSAEMVAVSSVMTYDVYQTYINPKATNKEIKRRADTVICAYGMFAGVLAIVLNNIGITIGYLYLLMGIIITGAVVPLACTLLWKKQNWYAVMCAPIIAQWSAIIGWLVCTKVLYNDINLVNTGNNYPMATGNIISLLMPIPLVYFISMYAPDDFDFTITQLGIHKVEELENVPVALKFAEEGLTDAATVVDEDSFDDEDLRAASTFAKRAGCLLVFGLLILWPLPLFFSNYVFSLVFFRGWVVFSIMWLYVAALFIIGYPLYESRASISIIVRSIINDISGKPPAGLEKPLPINMNDKLQATGHDNDELEVVEIK
eukprot:CAMPEP_0119039728 /NCGR_PEP_ID=MMETSP1177-20130426/9353_1 /TAXON_ID=2985 /ORGANISM="Ochromonas sp, Strain CCMP1899" /LENGTH=674 /DNA_ID=CAMNT_0007003951 /DNA_START=469 /DNA_END=2493 /DNA_ORIENTATION=-